DFLRVVGRDPQLVCAVIANDSAEELTDEHYKILSSIFDWPTQPSFKNCTLHEDANGNFILYDEFHRVVARTGGYPGTAPDTLDGQPMDIDNQQADRMPTPDLADLLGSPERFPSADPAPATPPTSFSNYSINVPSQPLASVHNGASSSDDSESSDEEDTPIVPPPSRMRKTHRVQSPSSSSSDDDSDDSSDSEYLGITEVRIAGPSQRSLLAPKKRKSTPLSPTPPVRDPSPSPSPSDANEIRKIHHIAAKARNNPKSIADLSRPKSKDQAAMTAKLDYYKATFARQQAKLLANASASTGSSTTWRRQHRHRKPAITQSNGTRSSTA
ncbi:hypothetical protein V5O48_018744, partial [Marasmius crinis-equi]